MKRLSLTAALSAATVSAMLLTSAPTLAQQIEAPEIASSGTVLSVSTSGSSSRTPDIATFTAGVVTTGKTAREALSANSAAMNRVIKALKAAGIADKDLQTSNLGINPVYGSRTRSSNVLEEQAPPIIGYRATNTVRVKQRKLNRYGKVIDTLVTAGANRVNGPNFQVEDSDEALDEARRNAMAKARKRAALYASAAGLKVKRILSITEGGSYSPRPPVVYARMAMDESAASPPVAAGEIELQANVRVMFELTP
ncbi:MAG: SIMPL domain-containing protein [Sphingomonadaceae bacterium]|nr:SIMPL domain-containing protein [Sphingomonadaceae bacterium]